MPAASPSTALPVLLALVLATAIHAQAPGLADETVSAPPAAVSIAQAGLELAPRVPYDAAVLTVAAGGRPVVRRVLAPGEPIAFAPLDADGQPLADGTYRWELRLLTERPGAGGGLEPIVYRQSGRFAVRGGAMEPTGNGGADLTLESDSPALAFADASGDQDFSIQVDADALTVVNQGVNDVMTLEMDSIGLFTATPAPGIELHIVNALPEIRLDNSPVGVWDLRVSTDDFQIVDADELFPPEVLEIAKEGPGMYTLIFDGDVVSTGAMAEGSSRDLKHDLAPASGADLLAALAELPIYLWSYRKDAPGVRHLGPVAEDFHAAFGLGRDDRHISPGDTAGLALAAIQALTARLEEREREFAELRGRLAALEAEVRVR